MVKKSSFGLGHDSGFLQFLSQVREAFEAFYFLSVGPGPDIPEERVNVTPNAENPSLFFAFSSTPGIGPRFASMVG